MSATDRWKSVGRSIVPTVFAYVAAVSVTAVLWDGTFRRFPFPLFFAAAAVPAAAGARGLAVAAAALGTASAGYLSADRGPDILG